MGVEVFLRMREYAVRTQIDASEAEKSRVIEALAKMSDRCKTENRPRVCSESYQDPCGGYQTNIQMPSALKPAFHRQSGPGLLSWLVCPDLVAANYLRMELLPQLHGRRSQDHACHLLCAPHSTCMKLAAFNL